MPTRSARLTATALLAAAGIVTACSSESDDDIATDAAPPADVPAGAGSGAGAAELLTGPGVSDDTITLGVLTDQSGPFAGASAGIAQGRQLFWDARNADGGVCGRAVEFVVQDHAYNAQNSTSLYAQQQPNVLAFDELLGSPMIAGLLPNIESDEVLTLAVSFSSNLLDNPYIVVTGATYDVEMINAVEWLVDEGRVAGGDSIGHIFLEGDYGENALAGTEVAAEEHGLELVEQRITPTDADLTAQVTALADAGVEVAMLTTTPPQAASAVGVAAAAGLDLFFVGSNPTYSPALLQSPAAGALQENYVTVSSVAPFASDLPGPTAVREAFEATFADATPTAFVNYGYAQGEVMAEVLETACENGDLTRAGVLTAFQSLTSVDTGGLVAPMDFSSPGQPPARETFVLRPDASVPGTLVVEADLAASDLALSFTR